MHSWGCGKRLRGTGALTVRADDAIAREDRPEQAEPMDGKLGGLSVIGRDTWYSHMHITYYMFR